MTYKEILHKYWGYPDFRGIQSKVIESIGATCLHELLRRVPSVTVELGKCYVRGGTAVDGKRPAAIAIDGIFVNDDYDLDNIQMSDVERVDVFKGGSTVIWGAIGGMGVISISYK